MGRADDALPVLRQVLEIDRPEQKDKHTFFEETVGIFIFITKFCSICAKCGGESFQREQTRFNILFVVRFIRFSFLILLTVYAKKMRVRFPIHDFTVHISFPLLEQTSIQKSHFNCRIYVLFIMPN